MAITITAPIIPPPPPLVTNPANIFQDNTVSGSASQTFTAASLSGSAAQDGNLVFMHTLLAGGTSTVAPGGPIPATTWTQLSSQIVGTFQLETWATIWQTGDPTTPTWSLTPAPVQAFATDDNYSTVHGVTNVATDILITTATGTSNTPSWPAMTNVNNGLVYRFGGNDSSRVLPGGASAPAGHTSLYETSVGTTMYDYAAYLNDQTAGVKSSVVLSSFLGGGSANWVFLSIRIPPEIVP